MEPHECRQPPTEESKDTSNFKYLQHDHGSVERSSKLRTSIIAKPKFMENHGDISPYNASTEDDAYLVKKFCNKSTMESCNTSIYKLRKQRIIRL